MNVPTSVHSLNVTNIIVPRVLFQSIAIQLNLYYPDFCVWSRLFHEYLCVKFFDTNLEKIAKNTVLNREQTSVFHAFKIC